MALHICIHHPTFGLGIGFFRGLQKKATFEDEQEIAAKVVEYICCRKSFKVYVAVPFVAKDEILMTAKRMYEIIGQAICRHSAKGNPTDYLNFFLLKETNIFFHTGPIWQYSRKSTFL